MSTKINMALMEGDLSLLNEDQLAKLWHYMYDVKAEREREWKESYGERLKELESILTQRLHTSGSTSFVTPSGTIHTVGRTTARVVDPAILRDWLAEKPVERLAYLDLKANMSSCRSKIEEDGEPVPGVELSTMRYLSITSPKKGEPNVQ